MTAIVGSNYDVRDLTKYKLLDAIYTATINDSLAQAQLDGGDSNGQLRIKINQLAYGFHQKHGIGSLIWEKILKCKEVFGEPLFTANSFIYENLPIRSTK